MSKETGKHREVKYRKRYYPAFPYGGGGHVVTRGLAQYIVDNDQKLVEYQGEDTR